MAGRTYYKNQSASESSTSSTSADPQVKCAVTFTPEPNSDYLIIGSWQLKSSSTSYAPYCIVSDLVGEVNLFADAWYPQDSTNYVARGGVSVMSFGASPVEQTVAMIYYGSSASGTYYIKNASLIAIKLESYDDFQVDASESTTTSTSWQDKLSLSLSYADAEEYLIIGSQNLSINSTSYDAEGNMVINGADYGTINVEPAASGNLNASTTMGVYEYSGSGTDTVKLQYRTESGSGTAKSQFACIVALKLNGDQFPWVAGNSDTSETTNGDTSYVTKTSVNTTNSSGYEFEHLILSSLVGNIDTTSGSFYFHVREGASSTIVEGIEENQDSTSYRPFFAAYVYTPSSSTIQVTQEFRPEYSFDNAAADEAVTVVMQVEAGEYSKHSQVKANITQLDITNTNNAKACIEINQTKNNSVKAAIISTLFEGFPRERYEAYVLPTVASPSWEKIVDSGFLTEEIVSNTLHVVGRDTIAHMYQRSLSGWAASETLKIVFRLKTNNCDDTDGDFALALYHNGYRVVISINDDEIFIKDSYISGATQTYAIDNTEFQRYEVFMGSNGITIMHDDYGEIINATLDDSTSSHQIQFGGYFNGTYGREWWLDYLRVSGDREQRVKANIEQVGITKDNDVKALIYFLREHENPVKANLEGSYQPQNKVKVNIGAVAIKHNSVKALIESPGKEPNYVKTDILVIDKTQESDVKANLEVLDITKYNSVKAWIEVTHTSPNVARAFVIGKPTWENYVKAALPFDEFANYVKGYISKPPFKKRYEYRVWDGNTFITNWSSEVVSKPKFRMVINGGPGEMVVRLARSFDDFGEDVDVKINNTVEVWCFDRDTPNGSIVYKGFISGYRPVLSGHSEYVEITLLHMVAELSYIMLRDGSGNTTITESSTDPSTMFENIVDYYQADGGQLTYTTESVQDTGTTVTYSFKVYTTKEALDKVIELTPENWFWRVDPDGTLYLQESNLTSADHSFTIGQHMHFMETWRRAEDIINKVYFVGDDASTFYREYYNTGSINAYGIHAMKYVDSRVSQTATADIMANRIITRRKDPEIRTTITVVDNNGQNPGIGYDIESIKPGQTMRIKNIKQGTKTITLWDVGEWDVDVWDQTLAYAAADVIQILAVDYEPNQVRIEASSRLPEISKRIEDIRRNWEEGILQNTAVSPTDGGEV